MHVKPTGKIGPIKAGGGEVSFDKIDLPKTKDEIEKLIANLFKKSMNKREPIVEDLIQNKENDIDFTITYKSGDTRPLELMEVVVDGGYESASNRYKILDRANQVFEHIKYKKSVRYSTSDIDLLLYSTDYKFVMSPECLILLGFLLKREKVRFSNIYFFSLYDISEGYHEKIFPNNYTRKDFRRYKDKEILHADPEKGQGISSPGSKGSLQVTGISISWDN